MHDIRLGFEMQRFGSNQPQLAEGLDRGRDPLEDGRHDGRRRLSPAPFSSWANSRRSPLRVLTRPSIGHLEGLLALPSWIRGCEVTHPGGRNRKLVRLGRIRHIARLGQKCF